MFELMQVQIPAVWRECISISKWSEPLHNERSHIFFCHWFLAEPERLEKTERLVYTPPISCKQVPIVCYNIICFLTASCSDSQKEV